MNTPHKRTTQLPAWAAGEPVPECSACGRHGQTLALYDGKCDRCLFGWLAGEFVKGLFVGMPGRVSR